MKIIAFGGLACSGKTTAAHMLSKMAFDAGYRPELRSFAGPLKEACGTLGASKALNPDLYRKTCQFIGKNYRDPDFVPGVTGPEYWVNMMAHALQKSYRAEMHDLSGSHFTERVVIIDDVRYPNEVSIIRDLGGATIYLDAIKRLGYGGMVRKDLPEWMLDPSEDLAWHFACGLLNDETFDHAVSNNATEVDLRMTLETLFPSILKEYATDAID